MEIRTTQIHVVPPGEPLYSEMATTVSVTDESGGEFVEVEQSGRGDLGKIMIEPNEWPALRDAIDQMIGECRPHPGARP